MKTVLLSAITAATLMACGEKQSAEEPPAARTQATGPTSPEWKLARTKDELTDEPRVLAYLSGLDREKPTSLHVRCMGSNLDTLVVFNDYLGNESRPVKYRFDQNEVKEESWTISGQGTALYPSQERDFARKILAAKKLIVEADDFRHVGHRVSFEWVNGEDEVREVLKACGVSDIGLNDKIPGLREDVALDIESWGPRNIELRKRALSELGHPTGEPGPHINSEFALAVQAFSDDFINKCKVGKVRGDYCLHLKLMSESKDMTVHYGSIIYEGAPRSLKKEIGSLRRHE